MLVTLWRFIKSTLFIIFRSFANVKENFNLRTYEEKYK